MYTSCPECGTVFRISTGDLRVAEGFVRCGHCSAIFNAVLTLSEEMPAALGPAGRDDDGDDGQASTGTGLPTAEEWLAAPAEEDEDDEERPEEPADTGFETATPGPSAEQRLDEPGEVSLADTADTGEPVADQGGPAAGEATGASDAVGDGAGDDVGHDTGDPGREDTGDEATDEPDAGGALDSLDWPLAPAGGGPREPPAEPAEWSTLFDEEDLREVTARIAVEIREGDDSAWPGPADDAGDEGDGDSAPVYLIDESGSDESGRAEAGPEPTAGEEAGAFGPWAWEAPAAPGADRDEGAESPYPPPPSPSPLAGGRPGVPVAPPPPDLWAEEFGDLVIEPADRGPADGDPDPSAGGRREPRLGDGFGADGAAAPQPGDDGAAPQDGPEEPAGAGPVTGREAADDVLPAPRWARDSLLDEALSPPRDPGEPGALPPLWAPQPGGWDDRAADEAREGRRRWAFGLGSLALGLLLVLQLIHQQRDDLATRPTLGPVLRQAYAALGFPLLPRWNLAAYEIRGTEAVAGRSLPGSLDVLARIHVVGTEAVGLPLVRVMLRDRFGKPLGSRTLEPAEYLEPGTTVSEPLAPGTVLTVRASLADPGSEAYGYEVDVCLRDRSTGLRCQSEQAPFRP